MLENEITAAERFTLVVLANRALVDPRPGREGYYAPVTLDTSAESPDRDAEAVAAVEKLISGKSLTSAEVHQLLRLAHIVDSEVAPGVVHVREAHGYEGRYGKLVAKLSMLYEAKRESDRFFEEYGDHSDEESGA